MISHQKFILHNQLWSVQTDQVVDKLTQAHVEHLAYFPSGSDTFFFLLLLIKMKQSFIKKLMACSQSLPSHDLLYERLKQHMSVLMTALFKLKKKKKNIGDHEGQGSYN